MQKENVGMSVTSKRRSARDEADRVHESIIARRVETTLRTASADGLTEGSKDKRLSGRAHSRLFAAAAANSGLDGSELLEYALAKVALEDSFVEIMLSLKGSIPRDVDLEF